MRLHSVSGRIAADCEDCAYPSFATLCFFLVVPSGFGYKFNHLLSGNSFTLPCGLWTPQPINLRLLYPAPFPKAISGLLTLTNAQDWFSWIQTSLTIFVSFVALFFFFFLIYKNFLKSKTLSDWPEFNNDGPSDLSSYSKWIQTNCVSGFQGRYTKIWGAQLQEG